MPWIDTHCHLDEESFHHEIEAVVQRAHEMGVEAMITIGTTLAGSRLAVALAERFPSVYAAVGIHPNYAQTAADTDWAEIEQLAAASPKVVAVGETGLDRYWDHTPLDVQQDYFRRHLELSRRLGKPFIVHCREAEADVLAELHQAAQAGPLNGVMHSFAGSRETAKACLELGLYLSFSGMITFRRSDELREVACEVPEDRLFVETDAPYLAPVPQRGKRNEPAFVSHTGGYLAEIRGVSKDHLGEVTTRNARQFFGL